mmetsp:Transcript_12967/g.28167  ORF Transcript_12967/g.28167 Transcript_12967/m.28167 type:complete len:123 (+) Transcript_12967:111-479(+)
MAMTSDEIIIFRLCAMPFNGLLPRQATMAASPHAAVVSIDLLTVASFDAGQAVAVFPAADSTQDAAHHNRRTTMDNDGDSSSAPTVSAILTKQRMPQASPHAPSPHPIFIEKVGGPNMTVLT